MSFYGWTPPATPGTNQPSTPNAGNSPLHDLCIKRAPPQQIRKAALDHHAEIDARNLNHMTPLGEALAIENTEAAAELVALGAAVFIPHAQKHPPFNGVSIAVHYGTPAFLQKVLLEMGGEAYINEKGHIPSHKKALTPLETAILGQKLEQTTLLLARGANPDLLCQESGLCPLHQAVTMNNPRLIRALFSAGANLEKKSRAGASPLHLAIIAGKYDAAKCLLEFGADPNARTSDGKTPLMLAAEGGNTQMTVLLLDHRARPDDISDSDSKETALHIAAGLGHPEVVSALLRGKANPLLTDASHRTAFNRAAAHGRSNMGALQIAERAAEQAYFAKLSHDAWKQRKAP